MGKYTTNTFDNFMTPHSVIKNDTFLNMTPSTQLLYMHLCALANRYSDKNGWFYSSVKQLMDFTKLSNKTICDAKKELIKKEFIDIKCEFKNNSKQRLHDWFRLNGFRFRT